MQAFIFSVVTVNDEHENLDWKESLGVKFKDDICVEVCLKLWFESDWYFGGTTESGWFWKRFSTSKVPNNHFLTSVWKSIWPEAHCETLGSYFQSDD